MCISEHIGSEIRSHTAQYTAMAVKFRLAGGLDVVEAPGWGVAALAWGLLTVSGGVQPPDAISRGVVFGHPLARGRQVSGVSGGASRKAGTSIRIFLSLVPSPPWGV